MVRNYSVAYIIVLKWQIFRIDEKSDINSAVQLFYEIIDTTIEMFVPECRAKNLQFPKGFSKDLKNTIVKEN